MLEELIQEKIKAIEVKVAEYESLISEIEKEKQFLQILQKEEKQNAREIEVLKHTIKAQEQAILAYKEFNIFQKLFSKEYKNFKKTKYNVEEKQNQDKNRMNETIKKTRKIREHIQITSRKIEDLRNKLDEYDIDALKGIQKKLDDAKNMLQLGEKPDEVIRHLQDSGILVDCNKTISKAITIPKETKYKLSNNMGNLEIKNIAQIWESKQSAKKESAIKGVYSVNYAVNGKDSKQSFLDSENLIVAIVLRTNESGEKEFALLPKENLCITDQKSQLITTWETPSFMIDNIDEPNQELKEKLHKAGFNLKNSAFLDFAKTPVCQSFSNQLANFMVLEVEKTDWNKKDNLSWVNLNYAEAFLNFQQEKSACVSSGTTIYAFLAFVNQYHQNRENFQTVLEEGIKLEEPRVRSDRIVSQKDIFMKSPRFQVVEVETQKGKKEVIAKSKNSVGAIYYRKENGKVMVGLQGQVRSPFLTDDKYKGVLLEMIGGMSEEGQDSLANIVRETREESGYEITKQDCKPILGGASLVTTDADELTELYRIDVTEKERKDMQLDAQGEFISSKIEWKELSQTVKHMQDLKVPLGTKISILLLHRILEKELEKEEERGEK